MRGERVPGWAWLPPPPSVSLCRQCWQGSHSQPGLQVLQQLLPLATSGTYRIPHHTPLCTAAPSMSGA